MTTPDILLQDNTTVSQQVLHPGSRRLFRYWESIRAERKCPDRADFNLKDVRDILSNLFILDFNSRTGGYTYRLSGSGITNIFKSEMTDKDALDGWDAFEKRIIGRVLNVAQIQLQPALVRMRFIAEHSQLIGAEMLALPIRSAASNGSRIQLIGGLFPFTNPDEFAYSRVIDRQLVTSRTIWTEHMSADTESVPFLTKSDPSERPQLRVIAGGRAD
jgi:hypothetical protein